MTGDFNSWNSKKHPMKSDDEGIWNMTVMLSPRKYEYKFLVDVEWGKDPRNDQNCLNCFGTRNSVLNLTTPQKDRVIKEVINGSKFPHVFL